MCRVPGRLMSETNRARPVTKRSPLIVFTGEPTYRLFALSSSPTLIALPDHSGLFNWTAVRYCSPGINNFEPHTSCGADRLRSPIPDAHRRLVDQKIFADCDRS